MPRALAHLHESTCTGGASGGESWQGLAALVTLPDHAIAVEDEDIGFVQELGGDIEL